MKALYIFQDKCPWPIKLVLYFAILILSTKLSLGLGVLGLPVILVVALTALHLLDLKSHPAYRKNKIQP